MARLERASDVSAAAWTGLESTKYRLEGDSRGQRGDIGSRDEGKSPLVVSPGGEQASRKKLQLRRDGMAMPAGPRRGMWGTRAEPWAPVGAPRETDCRPTIQFITANGLCGRGRAAELSGAEGGEGGDRRRRLGRRREERRECISKMFAASRMVQYRPVSSTFRGCR